ncbi:hypothetical protein LTR09_006325 [Extremus antarcticus]|uniref:BTB domain-containing protein n=1 Tax=Extremus antarcticus TaxID=702011 RepID=A0AAJ0GBP2_9PEZI|nr:hypothetical protein LTR09_006325 [Extremus antarcticus]
MPQSHPFARVSILCKTYDPESGFNESHAEVIELHDDQPEAVDAVLKYIYTFEYDNIVRTGKDKTRPQFHLRVYRVAHKYQIPKLQHKACTGLDRACRKITLQTSGSKNGSSSEELFELIKLITEHKQYDHSFNTTSIYLVQRYLSPLMRLKTFNE